MSGGFEVKTALTFEGLKLLVETARRNGKLPEALSVAMQWAESANHYISRANDPHSAPIGEGSTRPNLPPLGGRTKTKPMAITIDAPEDFEKRLDQQAVIEREIKADRWSWAWKE